MIWRIKALVRWLLIDPLAAWVAFGAPLLALALALQFPERGEFRIRLAGYGLTLAGVALVVRGILGTQQMFERPTYRYRISQWLGRLPPILKRRRVISMSISATAGAATMSARATVWSNAKDTTIDERVRVLELNLNRVREQLVATENRIDEQLQDMRSELSAESSVRSRHLSELSKRFEKYSTGSLDAELVGVIWVVIGQAFSSFPNEIAHTLGVR